MQKKIIYPVALLFLIVLPLISRSQVFTDTIFFNKGWRICEKPMAAYYRTGTLIVDSFWYYKGPFKDYSIDGTMIEEGNYSNMGYRDGLFNFYNPEGNLLAHGNYTLNKPTGDWEWKHANGITKAVINFPDSGNNYRFIFYGDSTGHAILDSGNGLFVWNTSAFANDAGNYKLLGYYKDGMRSGTWEYYDAKDTDNKNLLCKEIYDKDGTLKKAKTTGYFNETFHHSCIELNIVPSSLSITEQMLYDNFFKRGPDSNAIVNLWNYLKSRKTVDIVIKNKKFEDAIAYVIGNLEVYRSRIKYTDKDVEGKIEFKLGDSSMPENITVQGNISDKEKDFLLYLMSKFKNFEMPMTGSIGYEQYHTIYFYSIDMKPYVPASIRDNAGRELFFTMLPKDKYLAFLEANKKKVKRFIRLEFTRYF